MRRILLALLALLLTSSIAFADGLELTIAFKNAHTSDIESEDVEVQWYAQNGQTILNLTPYCAQKIANPEIYSFTIKPKETATVACTVEDADILGKLANSNFYAEVDSIFKGSSSRRWFNARAEFSKGFQKNIVDTISDGAKSQVKNVLDGVSSLLGLIPACDKKPEICAAGGKYFCYLTDESFKGLTIQAVSSVMDKPSNRDALGKNLNIIIGEDAANMAQIGCLPSGTPPEYFSSLLLGEPSDGSGAGEDSKKTPGIIDLSEDIQNMNEPVKTVVYNKDLVDKDGLPSSVTGHVVWFIKPNGEDSFQEIGGCNLLENGRVIIGGNKDITIAPNDYIEFSCGYPVLRHKPSEGPHDIKAFFVGKLSDGEKVLTDIKFTTYQLKTTKSNSEITQDCSEFMGTCKYWYEGCDFLTEIRKAEMYKDCGGMKYCCVPKPKSPTQEYISSVDIFLDKFIRGEICDNLVDDDDDNLDGVHDEKDLIDCEDPDCWGLKGPGGVTCCSKMEDCAEAPDKCSIYQCDAPLAFEPLDYGLSASFKDYSFTCQKRIFEACDPGDCGKSFFCNGPLEQCKSADDDKVVCESCTSSKWDVIHYKETGAGCCGDDANIDPATKEAHPEKDNWCNMNDAGNSDCTGGKCGACVYGAWSGDHCFDNAKDCDETGIDCGGRDCAPCSQVSVEGRGDAKISIFMDENENGKRDSGEILMSDSSLLSIGESSASGQFSIELSGEGGYLESKNMDSTGIAAFSNLKEGSYIAKVSLKYSNWRFTTGKQMLLAVKAGAVSEAGFGVQFVSYDLQCDSKTIVRGLSKTYTCTVKYAGTAEPVPNLRYELPLDGAVYSGVSDTNGVIKLMLYSDSQAAPDRTTGMFVQSELDSAEKQKIAVIKVGGGKRGANWQFDIIDLSKSEGSSQSTGGQDGPYWIVTGCSSNCANAGPCNWYKEGASAGFNGLIKAEDLCDQYFVGSICEGINLKDPNRGRLAWPVNPTTEIDEDGCGIDFTYVGSESMVSGRTCDCPTQACEDGDSDTTGESDKFTAKGLDIFTASKIVVTAAGEEIESHSDLCSGNSLTEYVCSDDGTYSYNLIYDCDKIIGEKGSYTGYTCMNGACIKDCKKCGWFNLGVCGQAECESLDKNCAWSSSLGVGTCGFR